MYRQAGLPEGTLVASFTIALQEEATDMGSVPLVMRIFPRHLLQHLLGRRRSELRVVGIGHHAGRRVGHLLFHDLGIELRLTLVDIRRGSRVDSPQSGIPDLSRQTVFPVELRYLSVLFREAAFQDHTTLTDQASMSDRRS
jgi:hypothetical protein